MLTVFLTLLFSLPIGILDAYVIRDMWLWFAVPVFGHPITVVQAFGFNLLVQSFISRQASKASLTEEPSLMPMIALTIGILVTWFIGYIVHNYF